MKTIYDLKRRAKELAAVSETNAVDPERVGNLIDDTLDLIDEYDKNVVSLGIRKTYATVAAMEADKVSPSGGDGKKLRFGQMVSVYDTGNAAAVDNGKVFAFQNPGWKLSSRVDAGYARSEKVAELENKLSSIYAPEANGKYIKDLTGILDLVIKNRSEGYYYFLSSVVSSVALQLFTFSLYKSTNIDGSGDFTIVSSLKVPFNSGIYLSEDDNCRILINTAEISHDIMLTNMKIGYELNESCYLYGKLSKSDYSYLLQNTIHENRSLIYDSTAKGTYIKEITGVLDLKLHDTNPAKFYSLVSYQSEGSEITINIGESDDKNGKNVRIISIFRIDKNINESIYLLNRGNVTSYIKVYVPELNKTLQKLRMFANEYKLSDRCFTNKGFVIPVNIFPFSNLWSIEIEGFIKELYIERLNEEDIRISQFRFSANEFNISLYRKNNGLAQIDSINIKTDIPSKETVYKFPKTNSYICIDFNKKVPFNLGDSSQYIIDEKCKNVENFPNIKRYISQNVKQAIIVNNNIIYDPLWINIERVFSEYKDALLRDNFKLYYDNAIGCNVLFEYRNESGYYSGFKSNLNYLKNIINASQGKYIQFGGLIKAKNSSTGLQSSFQIQINGISKSGWLASAPKGSTDWNFVHGYSKIDKFDASELSIEVVNNFSNVTDYSKENTFGVYGAKLFVAIYNTINDIPLKIDENSYQNDNTVFYNHISVEELFAKKIVLQKYNNLANLDEAVISALYNRYIGIVPNYNIPHTNDMGFWSTDVNNLNDTTDDDFSIVRGKAPNFFYKGKRRGCIILFDENKEPYIIDDSGQKKIIQLI